MSGLRIVLYKNNTKYCTYCNNNHFIQKAMMMNLASNTVQNLETNENEKN